jgi:hypothetical protein
LEFKILEEAANYGCLELRGALALQLPTCCYHRNGGPVAAIVSSNFSAAVPFLLLKPQVKKLKVLRGPMKGGNVQADPVMLP